MSGRHRSNRTSKFHILLCPVPAVAFALGIETREQQHEKLLYQKAEALGLLLLTILVRVFFESQLIAFHIAEQLRFIANAAQVFAKRRTN
jgi:hypothetical protein